MSDTSSPKRQAPQRRSALVASELDRLNIDVACLGECRIPGEGEFSDGNYTFLHSGRDNDKPKQEGVAIAMKSHLRPLVLKWKGINSRIMTMRLEMNKNCHATFISVYAPTFKRPMDEKVLFYDQLTAVLAEVPPNDRLFLLGDFNARVGTNTEAWPNVIGPNGLGEENAQGVTLLELCTRFGLLISNTMFPHRDIHKGTWKHPRSQKWHLIDFIIIKQHYKSDLADSRVLRSADCWTDHKLVRAKLNLRFHISTQRRRRNIPPRLKTARLSVPEIKQQLEEAIASRLPNIDSTSLEQHWQDLKSTLYDTSREILGLQNRNHRDWFDENEPTIRDLLKKKQQSFEALLQNESPENRKRYRLARNNCQRELRRMKNQWWLDRAAEIESYAQCHNSRSFFEALRLVSQRKSGGINPINGSDGTRLTKKDDILARWKEHFSTLLNQPGTPDMSVLDDIPQEAVMLELEQDPTIEEVNKALKQLKQGKAPGPDGIPGEVLKAGGAALAAELHKLLMVIWAEESVPKDFKNGTIIKLFKKNCRYTCGNYRGITLLAIVGKLYARIILNRVWPSIAPFIPEAQCSFQPGRSTTDMMFAVRQLLEKCREQHQELHLVFVDLVKAFDSVNREVLWELLLRIGIPSKIVNIIRSFHQDMEARVFVDGEMTEPFEVSSGLRQGCILAPTLFILFFSFMLRHAHKSMGDFGIDIRHKMDGKLFNLRRLKTKAARTSKMDDFLYADDAAHSAATTQSLQGAITALDEACKDWGLTISKPKTEVMHFGCEDPPPITIDNYRLANASSFTYLGGEISADASLDAEIKRRIARGAAAFHSLSSRCWERKGLTITTKVTVYKALVLPCLLYGSETWSTLASHIHVLEMFHQRSLRQILNVKWWHYVTNIEVLRRAKTTTIETMIRSNRLRWLGHVCRMPDYRIPKQLLFGELAQGKRSRGRPKKRWKDCIKEDLSIFGLDDEWHEATANRTKWRTLISDGKVLSEMRLQRRAEDRRERRHRRVPHCHT